MEKSIKEIIKKASCLIMICALVICSYPIQVVAAGFEISQDAEEKKDSGDKVSTVTKPESSTAGPTTEPKSSTTEPTTEPESSTEESTTEEDTIEESTTEEDTTEESTTEENTTGETVTEVDTAEEVVIVAAEVVKNAAVMNRNNNINVTVDSVNATIDSIDQPTYVSSENGNVGYFKVSVSGSARADFSVTAITGDGDPEQEDGDSKQEGEDTEQTSGETGEEDEGTEQTSGEISEEDEGTEQTSGETGEEDEGTEQTSGETDEEDEGTEQTSGETGEEDEDTKQEGVDPTQEDEDTKQEGVDPTQESKDTELTIGGAVSTTEDTDQTDTSSDTADVDQIKRDLASQYHVELRMICPSGGSKKIDESHMTVNGGNMSASVSCSEVSLTETGCYEFYIVVITPDSESVESVRQQVEITIPEQVGVKISEPEIKLAGYQECKEGNICTAFEIPYAVTAQISLTGIDDSVLAEQRESEIEYCLSQCKLAVKLDDQVLEEKALHEDDLVKSLMKSNDAVYTYTTEGSVKVCSAGEYCLQAVFNDSVTVLKTVKIDKVDQQLRYTLDKVDGKPYRFDETVTCSPEDSIYARESRCAETDQDGNVITDKKLTIEQDGLSYKISTTNKNCDDKQTHYITIFHKENEIYHSASQTIPITFERLENNICYVPSSIDEIYEYGEVITYSYQSGNLAGGITYYESDAAGNKIEDSQSLHIEKGEDGSFQVSGMSLSDAGKPFYVTFEHKENEVYKVGKQTFAFHVGKVKLEGCIKVNTVEKNYIFFKNRTMYVDVVVKAPKDNLTKDDAKKIKFNIQASLNSGSQNVFENMKCSLVKISYCGDRVNYRYKVNKESAQKLSSERIYTVRAVADYTEVSDKEVYYEEFSKVFDSLKVKRSQLEIDVQDEIIVELNNDDNQLDFVIKGERIEGEEGEEAFPVSCHIKADDPDVIAIKDNGVYETRKGGSTTITITVDDSSKYDIYEEYSTRVTITVKSPSNTDYTLNGQDPESFLKNPKATVGDEKWYDKDITLCFGENNLYNELCYRVSGNDDWKHVKARSVVIGESMPVTYEFYFCNTERNVASCIFKGNKVEEGKLEVMEKIGVDKTAPSWNPQLIANQQPSEHSTDTIRYFSDEIVLTGYVEKEPGDRKLVDSGSGIQKVFVQYGDSEEWTEYKVDKRYSGSYGLGLTENKNYGTVKMKAVDYLGHESNEAVYATEVCIDTVVPVVTMTPIDRNGNVSDYDDDSWTNQQLRFAISSLKDTQVSGIYCYEYAFIPRGSKMEIGKTEWKQIDEDELTLVFGTVLKHTQQTKEGTFLYTKDNSKKEKTESKAVRELEEYAKINGTLYVRAESNAGLVTTENDIQTNSKEVRIWQENLAEAKVIASSKPDSDTGWYNKQTGPVSLSFEYPEYDSENVAPAVGIVYTLTTQTDKDGEAVIVNKAFYKGIIDESSGKVIEVCDYKDKNSYVNLEKDGNIQIDKDSINTLTVYVEDAAGNQSDKTIFQINADFTAPQNLYADADGEELFIHLDGGESIVYKKFSQNAVRVNAHADYGISEKKGLYMALVKEQGAKEGISSGNAREELVMEPCSRGLIYLCAVDGAGNLSEGWTDGIVVDNLAPTGDSQPEIFIDAKGQNEAEFYHEDIPISIRVADAPDHDNYSGLKTVFYTIGRDYQATEENMPVFESNEISLSWEQIEKNRAFATDNIVIDAAKNESNNAYITITAADNAGNITTTTQELQIDVTAPQIEVTFNNNDAVNGTYYSSSRVARVDITELNFDPTQVSFKIYKDGEEDYTLVPSAASWNTSEGNVNTAYITFAEDGDYSLEVQCTDLAGNESDVEVTDSFTIDQTKPVVDVVYDNNNAWKGNYYNQARTATITVTEHNFDEKDFVITVTPNAALSGWTHNGDVHKASIRFDNEEHYSYAIDYTDLAGNKMDVFATEEFYIDRNVPTIQISGVADHSANAGEVIPVVMVADENYDADSVQITLQNSKGQQIALKQSVSGASGGYSYTLTNVNEQPDEIYTLTAAATDMAGNTSELSYLFSLNRNGSVYDLSRISVLVDKGYVRYADLQDLQIKEMNVNTIERFEIYVTRNGEIISSTEKKTRPNNADANTIYYAQKVNGNDEIGYEYDYTIYKESFRQEGIYNILLYSKDLAGNEVNNTLTEKEAELSFVVDNTAPTVVIEGVEAGVLYSEEAKDVNVYVSDNFKLQEAYFKLVDEDGKVIQTYPYMELAKENGEIVSITLPSSEKKLSIQYYAVDAAGNEMTTLPEENTAAGFMISTNAWIRYINNKRAVAGTIAAGVGAVPLSAAGMFFSRKRKMLKISK